MILCCSNFNHTEESYFIVLSQNASIGTYNSIMEDQKGIRVVTACHLRYSSSNAFYRLADTSITSNGMNDAQCNICKS